MFIALPSQRRREAGGSLTWGCQEGASSRDRTVLRAEVTTECQHLTAPTTASRLGCDLLTGWPRGRLVPR